jgi:hypothetical protein
MQQNDPIGVAAMSNTTATTRAHAACDRAFSARPAVDDMAGE